VNTLLYLLFISLFSLDYLSSGLHLVSNYVTLIPELLSGAIFILVLLKAAADHSIAISRMYLILAVLGVLHLLVGVLINLVSPGAIVSGLRAYVKWMPLFLLPAVYRIPVEKIGSQLKFLLFLALIQCPIALYQRLIQFKGLATGDVITGTVNGSGVLTIYLMATIALLSAFYYRGQLRAVPFLSLLLVLFLPTTINETKVTLFLLPIALAVPFIYASKRSLTGLQLIGIAVLGLILVTGYVTVYDHFAKSHGRRGILEFASDENIRTRYLYKDYRPSSRDFSSDNQAQRMVTKSRRRIDRKDVGRIDKLILPLRAFSEDPVRLWVGLGVGNASTSFLKDFSGEYADQIGTITSGTLWGFLFWETGVGGAILFLVFLYLIFRDTRILAALPDGTGTFASGWIAVVGIMLLASLYTNFFFNDVLIFLFAYFCGYIAAARYRHKHGDVST